jgi:hypothetical protein
VEKVARTVVAVSLLLISAYFDYEPPELAHFCIFLTLWLTWAF